jgi:hypothetical protein
VLDINRPPGTIGCLAALDPFAWTVRLSFFGAQRGNMFARPRRRFDLRYGLFLELRVACRRFCRSGTSRLAWLVSTVRITTGPGLARGDRLDDFRRFVFNFKRAQKISAGRFGERRPQLIAEHTRAHLLDRALGDIAKLERSEGKPDQPVDVKTDMFEHAFDFAVLAFAQRDREPAIRALHAIERCLDSRVLHAIERQALAELIENGLIGCAIGADPVTPDPAGRRQFEDARKAAVIGEQQQSFRINVEPADADDARAVWPMLAQKIKNRRPPLWVTRGRDEAARLMEQKEPRPRPLDKRLTVDGDSITRLDVDGRIR